MNKFYAGLMPNPERDEAPEPLAADGAPAAIVWNVGSVAERLGISPSTLRTWERRYGVGPTHRTAGGHRRYTETDIERVTLIKALIARGAPPMEAARVAQTTAVDDLGTALVDASGDDHGDDLEHHQIVDGIIAASRDYEPDRIRSLIAGALRRDGVIGAWTGVIAPALINIGREWSEGRLGIEAEHLTSEVVVGELRAHTRAAGRLDSNGPTIVLASAESDLHSMPLIALEAALADAGRACHVLGAQFPAKALASMTANLRPTIVFVWASLPRTEDDEMWQVVTSMVPPTTAILGGPGWPDRPDARGQATVSVSLESTVARITSLVG
ncbi:MerR family transcriptional regulator [Aeromicrobium endophyticum]|uniref:MerR family transcriptional regulator n=2 Tax=Aeromicrobium endophyticum TaxID=2292704 RepID=A0A371PBW3_9ACTN|nr:MerR family transcriptional regulator [Aeromicrobium endophyticum]